VADLEAATAGAPRLSSLAPVTAAHAPALDAAMPRKAQPLERPMIARIWHGWTTLENASAYETLLKTEVFESIRARDIAGFQGIDLLRREVGAEVEFLTIMRFTSLDGVRSFAGQDHETAVVPPEARRLLARFDDRSQHYDVKVENSRIVR
jgi:hypothetical protein